MSSVQACKKTIMQVFVKHNYWNIFKYKWTAVLLFWNRYDEKEEEEGLMHLILCFPHLWKCPIIPNVTFMGKYVGNISELSFLFILLDRIQRFLYRNLGIEAIMKVCVFMYVFVVFPLLKPSWRNEVNNFRIINVRNSPNFTFMLS